jgi:hypothetical protein
MTRQPGRAACPDLFLLWVLVVSALMSLRPDRYAGAFAR